MLVHLDVYWSPPDIVLARLLIDDSLVLGASAGLLSTEVDQGSAAGDDGAFLLDGVLVKSGNRCVSLQDGRSVSLCVSREPF